MKLPDKRWFEDKPLKPYSEPFKIHEKDDKQKGDMHPGGVDPVPPAHRHPVSRR